LCNHSKLPDITERKDEAEVVNEKSIEETPKPNKGPTTFIKQEVILN